MMSENSLNSSPERLVQPDPEGINTGKTPAAGENLADQSIQESPQVEASGGGAPNSGENFSPPSAGEGQGLAKGDAPQARGATTSEPADSPAAVGVSPSSGEGETTGGQPEPERPENTGQSRPRRRILIGSQRDPAHYRRRFFGEGVRFLGLRRDREEGEGSREARRERPPFQPGQIPTAEAQTSPGSQPGPLPAGVSESASPEVRGTPLGSQPAGVEDQSLVGQPPVGPAPSPVGSSAGTEAPVVPPVSALPGGSEAKPLTKALDESQPQVSDLPPAAVASSAEVPHEGVPSGEKAVEPAQAEPGPQPEISGGQPLREPESLTPPSDLAHSTVEEVPVGVEHGPSEEASPSLAETLMWDAIAESLPEPRPEPPAILSGTVGPIPSIPKPTDKLSPELVSELEEALAGFSMEQALQGVDQLPRERIPEDTLVEARVVGVHEDKVFVDLGVREQGYFSLKETEEPPEIGKTLQVRIVRFDPENSIYEVALPARAAEVAAWEEITVGMLVEARVTGVNAGGLECEVNHIRGFIPLSHIAPYRVTNPEEYVGQRLTCVVIEANRERRNLVLSRRAAIEREQEAAREALWAQLEPGQVVEGLVRKLMDFGAFVDLGGVDGLLHISQISWGRIHHPSQVLQEGQRIKVKILSVDRASKRISLAYRDLAGDPWEQVTTKYPENSVVRGKVTRIMPYGAFVELEPGVEGLVHISELAWKKVWRVSDVVKEGQEVDVVVMSVDPQARRISLSMKHLSPPPEETPPEEKEPAPAEPSAQEAPTSVSAEEVAPVAEAPAQSPPDKPKKPPKPERPLRGGLGPSPLGKKFGLNW